MSSLPTAAPEELSLQVILLGAFFISCITAWSAVLNQFFAIVFPDAQSGQLGSKLIFAVSLTALAIFVSRQFAASVSKRK